MQTLETTKPTWPAHGHALPAPFYVDPNLYRRELDTLFGDGWFCVAPVAALAEPGAYYSFTIGAEPLMAVRGVDGVLRVLTRVCSHRSMLIAEGMGRAPRFTCPYHSWTYGTDGKLLSAPLMEGATAFDKTKCALPSLATAEWKGFLFASFAADPAPFGVGLEGLDGVYPPAGTEEWHASQAFDLELATNWKLVVENASESYHHLGTHIPTLQPIQPAAHTRIAKLAERFVLGYNFGAGFDTSRLADKVAVSVEEIERVADPEGMYVASVFPNLIVAGVDDNFLALIVQPLAVDRSMSTAWLLSKSPIPDASDPDHAARLAFVRQFSDEDIDMTVGLARAVGSRFARGGPLSPYEGTLTAFHAFCRGAVEG